MTRNSPLAHSCTYRHSLCYDHTVLQPAYLECDDVSKLALNIRDRPSDVTINL